MPMPTTLILVPTKLEFDRIRDRVELGEHRRIALCGFGLVAASARASQLIAMHQPARVLLLGIAGSVQGRLPIGTATRFAAVGCSGIGAGSGSHHQSVEALGWFHWPGSSVADDSAELPTCGAIGDIIPLVCGVSELSPAGAGKMLVTVASASARKDDVLAYCKHYADADAEDMEGFGVAVACQMHRRPLTIIRGISNIAGDRDKSRWKIAEALDAVSDEANRFFTNC